jgi:CBS domain-containing protein
LTGQVRTVMTIPAISCRADSKLCDVAGIMWRECLAAIPVVTAAGMLIGMIRDEDVAVALGRFGRASREALVKDVVLSPCLSCKTDDNIHQALVTMAGQAAPRLPVVDSSGALVGDISVTNIVLRGNRTTGVPLKEIVATMKAIRAHTDLAYGAHA